MAQPPVDILQMHCADAMCWCIVCLVCVHALRVRSVQCVVQKHFVHTLEAGVANPADGAVLLLLLMAVCAVWPGQR